MEKRKIGSLDVSAIGYGCMGITHASGAPMPVEEGVKVLHQASEYGHGAAFSHLAVEIPADGASTEWLEAVADESYNNLSVKEK